MIFSPNSKKAFPFFLFLLLLSHYASAQTTLYSIGTSSASSPATSANWSLTSGGAPAGITPSVTTTLVFDSNSNATTLNGAACANIIVEAGYTDTIDVLSSISNFTITGSLTMQSGCFRSNNNASFINTGVTIGANATFIAPNNTIRLGGIIDMQGTWVHNNGTVKIYSTPTFRGIMTFNNMEFPLGVVKIDTNSMVTVAGFMDIQNLGNMVINGPGEIRLHGDLYYRNTNSQGTSGIIRFVGTGDQFLYGNHSLYGTLPSLIVDKPSGTLFLKDTIGGVKNPIRLLQGTLDATTYQSTVSFNSSLTLKESIPLYHVFITPANSAFNIDSNADMQINGNLTINANGFNTLSINGPGEIWLKGNLYNKSGSQGSGGNGTIRFNGVGEQVLLGNHNLIYGSLPKLIIDKPSGTLFFKDTIGGIKNPIQLVQGTLDASTYQSTLSICGSMTFKENMSLHHVIINGNTTNINIDTTKLLTINGDLKLTGSGGNYPIFINGPGEIQIKGNLFSHSLGNNGSGGSGAIRFVGENDQTLFGNKIFSNSSLPSLIVDKPSGTLFLRDSILGIKNSLRYVRGGFDATTYQSTVYFNGSVKLRENLTFHNVIFRPANSSISIDSNVTMHVEGNLTIESIHNTPIYINGPGEIRLKGSLINNNICYGDGGNGTIRFTGSGNQILNGNHNILYGSLPQLIIDKPSGTLFLKDTIGGVKNPIRLLQGTLDASTYNSTVAIVGNYSQKESISFNHLYINPGNSSLNIDTNKVLQVNGDLTIANASGWSQLINGPGEIQLKGNLYNNNLYTTGSGGNGTIRFTGTTDQIFRGNHHLTYGSLPQIIIDKPSGTLFLKDTIGGVKNPIRLLNGNVDASTFQSTVGFFGTFNLKDNLSLHHVVFSPVNSSFNIDTNKVLQVNGNLTIFNMGGNNQAINGPGVMHINGNIYNNNTSYGSGGTGTLIVNGAANQTITGQNAEGVGKLPSILIRKPSGTLQISNKVSTSGSFLVEKGSGTFTDTTGTVFMYGTNGSISNESDSGYVQIPNVKLFANSQLSGKLHVTKQIDLGTYTLALNNFGVQNDNPDSTTSLKYSTTGGFVTSGSLSGSYSQKCLLNKGYKVPFRKADNTTITPITFRLDTATTTDSTYFTVSTYGTDPSATPNNRPLPQGLEAILDSNGHDATGFVLDRYWNCKVSNTSSFTSAQLKVSFLASEYGAPNSISSLTNLKAYGYSGANEIENIGISGSVSATSTSLQLKNATNDGITLSTLPINRGGGMGNAWDEIVCSSNALLCVKVNVTPGAKGSGEASLHADIKRGQGPFTYIWSNGATSSTIENVNAGYYEVTVTDASGNQVAVQQFGGQQVSLDTTISVLDSLNELIAISPDSFMVDSSGNKFMLYGLAYGKNRLGADGNGTVSYEWEKGSDFTGAVGMIHDLSFEYGYGMMVLPIDSPTGSGSQRLVVAGEEETLLGIIEDNKPLRLDIVQDETGVKFFKNKVLVHAFSKDELKLKGGNLTDVSPGILFMKPWTKIKAWTSNIGLKADPFDEEYKSSGKVPTDVTYYIDDHLGNLRVSYKPELTCSTIPNTPPTVNYNLEGVYDYSAYGRITRSYTHNTDRYLSTQHERDAETGGLEGYDYRGARLYDSDNGRFMSIDPLQAKLASWAPYVNCKNNPIMLVDPDGKFPYPIHIRAFAPFKSFGGGFAGDDRGFSSSLNVTSRLNQSFTMDPATHKYSGLSTTSSESSHSLLGRATAQDDRGKISNFVYSTGKDGSNSVSWTSTMAGHLPLIKGSPDIDVKTTFCLTENTKAGTINVSVKQTGDAFPSAETLIGDTKGNQLLIGVSPAVGTPYTSLPGEGSRPMMSENFVITIDENGVFTGVIQGNTKYSIADWNKKMEAVPAVAQPKPTNGVSVSPTTQIPSTY